MKHGQFVLFTIAPMPDDPKEWGTDEEGMAEWRKFDRRVCRISHAEGGYVSVQLSTGETMEMVDAEHLHEFPIPDVHFDIQTALFETGTVLPVDVSPNDVFDVWCDYEGLRDYGHRIRKLQWASVQLVDWLPGRKKTQVDEAFFPAVHGAEPE